MLSSRYTIVLADRRTGVVRRFTVAFRSILAVVAIVLALPVLIGMGAAWKAKADVADLYAYQSALELENANYRGATEALTGQIRALQAASHDLGGKAALDPALQSAMDKLPAIVKNRAMGGGAGRTSRRVAPGVCIAGKHLRAAARPAAGLESRLRIGQLRRRKRNALAAATPSIWPAQGWLTSADGSPHRSVHRRSRLTTPASTSPPTAARRCTPPPTARSARPSSRAPTAT